MARLAGNLRIVLVGKTGSGKSATGNTILGRNVFEEIEHPNSVTKECQKETIQKENRMISVIDTPGFHDTEQVEEEIEKCLMLSAPGPHVFLLVLRMDMKITNEEKNTMKIIEELCGKDTARNAMVLFTHADPQKYSLNEYIEDSQELQQLIIKCYGRYHAFNNTNRENQAQVTELLEKIDKMVITNGGNYYTYIIDQEDQKRFTCHKKCMIIGATCVIAITAGMLLWKKL